MSEYDPNRPPQSPHAPMSQYVQPVARVDAPGASAALVFGILSIVISGPIIGLILGWIGLNKAKEVRALIAANPGYYSGDGTAQAGYICSIVGMCISGLSTFCLCGYLAFVVLMIFGAAAGSAGGP